MGEGVVMWAGGSSCVCVGGRPCMKQESGVSPLELCLSSAFGCWGQTAGLLS